MYYLVISYNQGLYDSAIKFYNKALDLDSTDKAVWYRKGIVLDDLRHYDQAIVCFKAIELDPNDIDAWDYIGWVNYKSGNFDKALNAVNNAIGIDPNFANGWYNKSIYIIKKGNIDEVISYLKRAIELDTNCVEQVRTDTDFDDIRNYKRFIESIEKFLIFMKRKLGWNYDSLYKF